MCVEIFLSWVHDTFMCMVHEIFHVMVEIKESRLCWFIQVSIEMHGKVFRIISILNSDLH